MIIPNKHSGYQAGVRLYPFGGGGSSEGSVPGMGDSQIGNTGGTTPIGTGVNIPPPVTPVVSVPGMGNSQIGNTGGTTPIGTGVNIPPLADVVAPPAAPPTAPPAVPGVVMPPVRPTGMPTGIPPATSPFRPMSGADQFYQPVYQPQYQDYNVGNRMGVSQYGQSFGGFNPFAMQMQTPFNPYTNSFQPQMGMGMQTPFSSGMSRPRQQPIVTRSAQARGTPNVMMRRAEGGIASLVDDE